MTAESSIRRSPVEDHASEFVRVSASGVVTLAEAPLATMLNLRVGPGAESRVEQALGFALPGALRGTSSGDVSVLWLGPDEYLVITPLETHGDDAHRDDADLVGRLTEAADSGSVSVVDVSANRTTISLGGPRAGDVLDKGIAIDLHPSVTESHDQSTWCAQTLLTNVPIILWKVGPTGEDAWRLLVRPSFANYVADWLIDAATEFTG